MKRDYSPKILEAVMIAVNEKIKNTGSSSAAAASLGVNPGTVTFLKNGDWKNVSDEVFTKVQKSLHLNEWRTFQTTNFSIAATVAKSTKDDARMVALVGYTGAGKTHSLSTYAKKSKDVFYLLADTEMTKLDFLKEIGKACGINNLYQYSKNELIRKIVSTLVNTGSALLIIDDSGKLSDANLRLIQVIYDRTEFRCGILLAGTHYLKTSIDRKAAKDVKGFQELKRRIAYTEVMKEIAIDDVRTICVGVGIEDESAIIYLHRECKDFGTLRNQINNVLKLSAKRGEPVTNELLAKMNMGRVR
jgi:DNA transposition AAA+ family ATPase